MAENSSLPAHSQLLLPLLEVLAANNGKLKANQAVEAVAEKLSIPEELRSQTTKVGTQKVNLFARRVRWVRQDGVRRQFISREERTSWILSDKGAAHLQNCALGIVFVIYETDNGTALWADAFTASAVLSPNSINLILTSPPYPLVKQKEYGNKTGNDYLDWLSNLAKQWHPLLVDDGSLVLNLSDTWQPGQPTMSLYQEKLLLRLCDELGYHLAQRLIWHNPCKIPATSWVTVKRCRLKTTTENIFWLSKTPHPKADNRRILVEYNQRMRKTISQGGERMRKERPSGHGNAIIQFGRDNGGTIPANLLISPNATSNSTYIRKCREAHLPIHPARAPQAVVELLIQLLTDPGDLCYDPFGGSNTLGEACERLNRRWISCERSLAYINGSRFRFEPNNLIDSELVLSPI